MPWSRKRRVGAGITTTATIVLSLILIAFLVYLLTVMESVSATDLDARPLELARRRAQLAQLNDKEPSSRLVPLANRLSPTDLVEDDDPQLGVELSSMYPAERRRWVKMHWSQFKLLQSDSRSEEFPRRIKAFFDSSPDRCQLRFFKTWIAPASEFQSRELICLLSVFKHHPTACVVILSKSLDNERGREVLSPLVDAGYKVTALSPDLPFLFAKTPLNWWLKSLKQGRIDPGRVPLAQNLSNVLRLLALYKYGGIYLDNDMLVLRSMAALRNVVGAQSQNKTSGCWKTVNNAILCFDRRHPVVHSFLKEFGVTFNGNIWGHNGPYLATRVLSRRREEEQEPDWAVLPKEAFYPLDWKHIGALFSAPENEEGVRKQLDWLLTNSYAIHLWNRESRKLTVQTGSPMDLFFRWVLDGTNFMLGDNHSGSSSS